MYLVHKYQAQYNLFVIVVVKKWYNTYPEVVAHLPHRISSNWLASRCLNAILISIESDEKVYICYSAHHAHLPQRRHAT